MPSKKKKSKHGGRRAGAGRRSTRPVGVKVFLSGKIAGRVRHLAVLNEETISATIFAVLSEYFQENEST